MKPLSPKSLEKKYAELGLPKAKTDLLHDYFLCFANLYGMLEVREAWNVFKHYEGNRIRKKDFIAFSGIVQREPDLPYTILELNEVYADELGAERGLRRRACRNVRYAAYRQQRPHRLGLPQICPYLSFSGFVSR